MKPALTAEEWERRCFTHRTANFTHDAWARDNGVGGITTPGAGMPFEREARHALAALALYGQTFGFAREDVELLTWLLRDSRDQTDIVIDDWLDEARTARLRSLTKRLAALLPPEK